MTNVKRAGLVLVAISLLVVPLSWSQGGNPPASTKGSGATSGHGMTAVEQTGKGGGNVEEQIKRLSDQLGQAYLKGDTSFFEKYLADEYTAIRANGQLLTKSEDIGSMKYESFDVREMKIHAYGDTAVVTSLIFAKGTMSGRPWSGDYRNTRVWVKQNGNWKVVAFQTTRIPPSQ